MNRRSPRRSAASETRRDSTTRTVGANPNAPDSRHAAWVWSGLILLLTFVVYIPAISGEFIWDDDAYVTRNPALETPDGLRRIWFDVGATIQYYPLVFTTFWIEHQIWGNNPVGYHVVNILLHGLAAVLLGHFLRRLEVPGAWLAAAIFAVHPVHAESVAWVTERKNVLSLCFYLGAAMAYLRFTGLDENASVARASGESKQGRYFLALALFTCALLSKTATVGFPIAMLLVIWWKRGRVGPRDVAPLAPFFAASLAAGLVTTYVEAHHVGAGDVHWTLTIPQRCLLAGQALCFYLSKLVWPAHLTFVYGRWDIDPSDWRQYVFPLAVIVVLVSLWGLRKRLGRGPVAAVGFFIVSLAPALGFVKYFFMNYSFVGDHFQYLASIGPIVLFAGTLGWVAQRVQSARPRMAIRGLQVAVVGLLALLTVKRCGVFQNIETLFQDVLAKSPRAQWMAHYNLGVYYYHEGRFEVSAIHYLASLQLEPAFPDVRNSLAAALHQAGRTDEAVAQEREALRLRPNYVEAASNLGYFLDAQGRLEEAAQAYRKAIEIDGNFVQAYHNLAYCLVKLGRTDEASAAFRQVLRINPADTGAASELARLQGEPTAHPPTHSSAP